MVEHKALFFVIKVNVYFLLQEFHKSAYSTRLVPLTSNYSTTSNMLVL